jgi:phage-related minor tail protein
MANLNIAIKIAAQDAASGPIGQIRNALGGLSDSARSGFAGLQTVLMTGLVSAAAVGGAALLGIGAAAFSVQGDVRQATNAIIVGTGASGEALDEMRQSVINLAGSTSGLGHEMGTIGGVMAELNTRTGVTGDQLETTTGQFLEFTRLAGGDGVRNVQLVTRVMGDWGVENEHTGQTLDMLFGASQAFGVGVDRIAQQVVQFGAPLRQMGFSLEESIALFGKWEKEGVNAELAVGSLRIAAGKFARDNIPLQDGLRDTMDAIKGATDESEALAIAMDVFGARAGPDMAAAIREGRFELDEAIEALRATEGGLADAAERTVDFRDRFTVMMTQARLSLLPLGDSLAGIAENFMPRLSEVLETRIVPAIGLAVGAVATFFDAIGDGLSFVEALWDTLEYLGLTYDGLWDTLIRVDTAFRAFFGGLDDGLSFVEALWDALEVLGLTSDGLWSTLITLDTAIRSVIDTVVPAIAEFVSWKDVLIVAGIVVASVVIPALAAIVTAALPVIAVAVALIAGVALLRNAWENDWGGMRTALINAWENHIQPALAALQRWVVDEVIPAVQNLYRRWVDEWWPQISTALINAWETISEIFGNLKRWVTDDLIPTVVNLYETWSERWSQIETALNNSWTVIEAVWTELGRWINDNIMPWVSVLSDWWSEKWGEIETKVATVWAVVEPIWIALGDWLDKKIPEILGRLQGKWETVMGALQGPADAVRAAIDNLLTAAQGFWNWLSSKTFSFNISIPDLPSWAIPGSPLPIHTAWSDFARDMSGLHIRPDIEMPVLAARSGAQSAPLSAQGGSGGGRSLIINVDARGSSSTADEIKAAVKMALREVGASADNRIRTGSY